MYWIGIGIEAAVLNSQAVPIFQSGGLIKDRCHCNCMRNEELTATRIHLRPPRREGSPRKYEIHILPSLTRVTPAVSESTYTIPLWRDL